jgi:hypothetical protein
MREQLHVMNGHASLRARSVASVLKPAVFETFRNWERETGGGAESHFCHTSPLRPENANCVGGDLAVSKFRMH